MAQYDNCVNCFMPLGGRAVCPYCHYDPSTNRNTAGVLPPFTILNNRYLVGRMLGKGGFGVTYIGKDMMTNNVYAIKEYMPAEYSVRSGGTLDIVPFSDAKSKFVFNHGRDRFVDEARTLLKLKNNPIVVDIVDYFTQNNTAYFVMEYLDGKNLRRMAKDNGGKLDAAFVKEVFLTVASSLVEIHRLNILHRDISPENIMVSSDKSKVTLIDFGAARNFVSTQNKGMSILLKPGFAPPEQYSKTGAHGPWSDVYALCATFYNLVSGKPLIDALFRYRGEQLPSLYSLGCNVTKKTSEVIERGMELDYKRRYQNFMELLNDIDIAPSVDKEKKKETPKGDQTPYTTLQVPPQHQSINRPYVAAVVGGGLHNKVMVGTNDIFKIGRLGQSCQYVVQGDPNISRIHCYIRFDGKNIFIADTSSNGTFFANGTRLAKNKEYQVPPGTRFYLATVNHVFVVNF